MIGRHSPRFHRLVTSVSCLQAVQSEYGITIGGTLLAAGTTPPVLTFTGTQNGKPYPIWVKCNTTGGARGTWTGDVYYDGAGSTSEQSFTSAATVALTGKGAGLTLNIAAGNAATDNVWKATCSGWADQSGAGKDYAQASASAQPLIALGLNGFPSLEFDGSNDIMTSSLTLAAPGTTPTFIWAIIQQLSWTSGDGAIGSSASSNRLAVFSSGVTPQMRVTNGVSGPVNAGAVLNTWVRLEALFNNNTTDYLKLAATSVTGTNAGNTADATGRNIGALNGTSGFGNFRYMAVAYFSGTPSAGELAALNAAAVAKYGASVGV